MLCRQRGCGLRPLHVVVLGAASALVLVILVGSVPGRQSVSSSRARTVDSFSTPSAFASPNTSSGQHSPYGRGGLTENDGSGSGPSEQQLVVGNVEASDAAHDETSAPTAKAGSDAGGDEHGASASRITPAVQGRQHPLCRARHPDMVVYNRLPKCGSATLMRVLHSLPHDPGFRETSDERHNLRRYTEEALVQQVSTKFVPPFASRSAQRRFGFIQSHQFFVDFTGEGLYDGTVVTINIARDPVDRCVSEYYWITRKMFGKLALRGIAKKDVNECAAAGCFDTRGKIIATPYFDTSALTAKEAEPWARQLMKETCNNYLVRWFCGMDKVCMDPSSAEALERAEMNIRDHHLVVGVMEDLPTTFALLDALLPDVFGGAANLAEDGTVPHEHEATYVPPSDATRQLLEELNAADMRLYSAIKERLQLQAKTCGVS